MNLFISTHTSQLINIILIKTLTNLYMKTAVYYMHQRSTLDLFELSINIASSFWENTL